MRIWIEYWAARITLGLLRILPRNWSFGLAKSITGVLFAVTPRLRSVADQNLVLALPHLSAKDRERLIRGVYRNLARVLHEAARFPILQSANLAEFVAFEGFHKYEQAVARGNGVIFLTAHLGVWELGAFAHALRGYPLQVVYRALDNPLLDQLVRHYRQLCGNRLIEKRESARGIIAALGRNETVGILADQNTLPDEGVFVDFFGVEACMTAGVARFALHTGAAVVPAFCVWEKAQQRYCIHYDKALTFVPSGNSASDVQEATQRMAEVIEQYVRRYPDQWLWIHRRWKTRPPGKPPVYQ